MSPPSRPLEVRALLSQTEWVRALARKLVRDPHLADDLAQDACLAALRHRPAGDRPLRAWLGTVLRNLVRQDARTGERRTARELMAARDEATPSAAELVERVSAHRLLVDAVMELTEPYRSVMLLRYFEDLSPKEIARRQGVPLATVKTRLARGLERLRARLERDHGGHSWLPALLPLIHRHGGWSAPTLGVLAVSTQLKLALVAVAVVTGLVVVWPEGESGIPEGVTLAADHEAAPVELLAHDALLADEPGLEVRRTAPREGPAAAAAQEPEAAPVEGALLLRGTVFDADAVPAAGVSVRFVAGADPDRGGEISVIGSAEAPRTVSRARGAFELAGIDDNGVIVADGPEHVTVYAGQVAKNRAKAEPVVVVAPRHPLAGRVVDEAGRPIEGAVVRFALPDGFRSRFEVVMDYSSLVRLLERTDVEGAFDLSAAPRINGATLSAELEGYIPVTMPVPEYPDAGIVMTLRRPAIVEGTLAGQVVDQEGRPVPEARVSYGVEMSRTDEYGFFHFDMHSADSPNRFAERLGFQAKRLVAVKEGYQPGALTVGLASEGGEPAWPDNIVLQLGGPPLSIAGRVVDTAGKPLVGVRVWATNTMLLSMGQGGAEILENVLAGAPAGRWHSVETDAHGDFEVHGLSARAYSLAAMDEATLLRADSGSIEAGATNVRLTLDDGELWKRVAGRVVTKDGEPVADLSVAPMTDSFRVRYQGRVVSTSHSSVPGTVTDDDGAFELAQVPKSLVYLRLDGESIIPVEYGRRVEGGLGELAGGKLEELEIVVPMRVHLQVTLAAPDTPGAPDALEVLDAAGERITINVIQGTMRREEPRVAILNGVSDVLTVTDSAATLVLYRDEEEVERLPLDLVAGELNRIRP